MVGSDWAEWNRIEWSACSEVLQAVAIVWSVVEIEKSRLNWSSDSAKRLVEIAGIKAITSQRIVAL